MKQDTLTIRSCPACGSPKIRRVRRRVTRAVGGRKYAVPSLSFYECPACGEKLYDRHAMRRIEGASPAYRKAKAVVSSGR